MRTGAIHTLENWPRRKNGELIFRDTNEAIYYADITDDRLGTYEYCRKWRKKTLEELEASRRKRPVNWNRCFDLAVRG